MRILCLGDVVGEEGLNTITAGRALSRLRDSLGADLVIVNGENSAPGNGMTPDSARAIFDAGADVITGGNHTWRRREVYSYLDDEEYVIRPANYPDGAPGRGHAVLTLRDGRRIAVLNVLGTTYMDPLPCPFRTALDWTEMPELEDVPVRLVDFHAEATSEKYALFHYLAGRVAILYGTHTHVQTADEQVYKGTGYITDLGMTGPTESVLGVKAYLSIAGFRGEMREKFETADGPTAMNGALFELDADGSCRKVIRISSAD